MIQSSTHPQCTSSTWLVSFSFIIVFGSLFVKTQRMYMIFKSKIIKIVAIRDIDLLKWLSYFIVMELALRIANEAKSPFVTAVAATASNSDFEYYYYCTSPQASLFYYLSIIDKAILLLFGVFLAIECRDIDKNFNETKILGITIYNCAVTCLIILPVIYALDNGVNPVALKVISVLAINYVLCFTLTALIIPKIKMIRKFDLQKQQSTNQLSSFDRPPVTTGQNYPNNLQSSIRTSGMSDIVVEDDIPFSGNRMKVDIDRHIAKINKITDPKAKAVFWLQAIVVLQNSISSLNALNNNLSEEEETGEAGGSAGQPEASAPPANTTNPSNLVDVPKNLAL